MYKNQTTKFWSVQTDFLVSGAVVDFQLKSFPILLFPFFSAILQSNSKEFHFGDSLKLMKSKVTTNHPGSDWTKHWKIRKLVKIWNCSSDGGKLVAIFVVSQYQNSHVMSWCALNKLSERCQMSKKSNSWTREEVHKKLDTMRLTHDEVHFDVTHEGNQNWSNYEYFEGFWWASVFSFCCKSLCWIIGL